MWIPVGSDACQREWVHVFAGPARYFQSYHTNSASMPSWIMDSVKFRQTEGSQIISGSPIQMCVRVCASCVCVQWVVHTLVRVCVRGGGGECTTPRTFCCVMDIVTSTQNSNVSKARMLLLPAAAKNYQVFKIKLVISPEMLIRCPVWLTANRQTDSYRERHIFGAPRDEFSLYSHKLHFILTEFML